MPDALLFSSRNGTPFGPSNVRNQLRRVLARVGLDDVRSRMFRRRVATAVHARAGVDLAAELLGHADPRIKVQRDIRRNEMVNPTTADMLEAVFSTAAGARVSCQPPASDPAHSRHRSLLVVGGLGRALGR